MRKADEPMVARIIKALDNNPEAVERAILLLGKEQTSNELNYHGALEHNGRGFSKAHAAYGTWAYDILKNGGHLHGHALAKCRHIAKRYARTQLLAAAKEKMEQEKTINAN